MITIRGPQDFDVTQDCCLHVQPHKLTQKEDNINLFLKPKDIPEVFSSQRKEKRKALGPSIMYFVSYESQWPAKFLKEKWKEQV